MAAISNTTRRFFKIGVTELAPWFMLKSNSSQAWDGLCYELLTKIALKMNFDYEIIQPESGTFGEFTNNSWDGVIGDLIQKKTDFIMSPVRVTADLFEEIDFVTPFFITTGLSIVTKKAEENSLFRILGVLNIDVWLSILGVMFLTAIFIWMMEKSHKFTEKKISLIECIWFSLMSITPIGGGKPNLATSTRIFVSFYWIFLYLMIATFTANLAAFLTYKKLEQSVLNMEDLSVQKKLEYSVVNDSLAYNFFKNLKIVDDHLSRGWVDHCIANKDRYNALYPTFTYILSDIYARMYTDIQVSGPVEDAEAGFKRVLEEDFAFIHDSSEIKYRCSIQCDLDEIGKVFSKQPLTFGINKERIELKTEIGVAINDLLVNGFIANLITKYMGPGNCSNEDRISLTTLGGVFIIAFLAIICAGIHFLMEYRQNQKEMLVSPFTVKT